MHRHSSLNKVLSIPAAILVAGFFFSCQNTIEEIDSANDDSELPAQTIFNGSFDYTVEGKLLQRITAGELNQYQNENLEASEGVRVDMFNSNEEIEAFLTSETGTYFQSENKLTARDSVVLTNAEGDVLYTDELTLLQDSSLIFTDYPIEIHKGDNVIFGTGLRADSDFSKYQIKNPARSRIIVQENDTIKD
ncbi:MAG: LPS export ABC transporter periplasmic protein LptC [Flavobacteriales bacterium]